MSTGAPASGVVATLAARSVTKRFGSRAALHDVSFEVRAGELVAVFEFHGWATVRVPDPDDAVGKMLAQTDLADRADEQVSRLSGGNQQRVNIAIGLLCDPAVLLLDEPSSSLDPRQREGLWEFIGDLAARGTTVLYSTHNVAEAERYADRVLVLVDGELLFTGTPAELDRAVGADARDFEAAFVRFLHAHGH